MNRTIWQVLLSLAAAAGVLFALSGCGKKTVTVTFSVDGRDTVCEVERGALPVFEGSVEKAADAEHFYRFRGWDHEIVPAEEDALYVAQYDVFGARTYTIRWALFDDVYTTTVHEGETPAVPEEFEEVVVTDALTATFTGWDQEIVPAAADAVYRAQYKREGRVYDVVFRVDGETVATVPTKYNSKPTVPETEPVKEGWLFSFWANADEPVRGETVCDAVFTQSDPEQMEWAMAQTLTGYQTAGGDNGGSIFSASSAMLYLALEEHGNPSAGKIRDQVLAHLRNLVSGGKEPYFDLEPYWNYVTVTAGIAVSRATPTIWDALSADEQARLDCVMRAFAYVLTLGTADANSYTTGPGLTGNFNKGWNPNYRLSNVTPMLFVTSYFGSAEAVNTLLQDFDFDRTMAEFKDFGFTRAYARWSTEPPQLANGKTAPSSKEFMENGGTAYLILRSDSSAQRLGYVAGQPAGSGKGVRVEYKYGGYSLSQPDKIFNQLLENCYSGGKVINSYGTYADGSPKAYILNGGSSPVLGLDGMMLEFKSGDGGDGVHGGDIRSSCSYTSHDFIMVTAALAALRELGIYDLEAEENAAVFRKVWVGNTDVIYKIETGYMSYSLGKGYESHESANNGYLLWKSWWNHHYGDLEPEELPEPQTPASRLIDFETKPEMNSNGIEVSNYGETFGIQDVPNAHSGNSVFYYRTQNTYNRIRFLNLFDDSSIGKTYTVSFWYYVENLPMIDTPKYENYFTVRAEQNIKEGKNGFAEQKIVVAEAGKWLQYTYDFTFTEEMAKDAAYNLVFRFYHLGQVHGKDAKGTGATYVTVMLDDLSVELKEG